MFNVLFNLSLGIIGGIISSIIVSRMFMIQGNYREQLNAFNMLIRKLGYIDGMFFGIRAVLEVSYDSNEEMKKEMATKGYQTEDEYYMAHLDKDWISKEHLLNDLLNEIKKITKTINSELLTTNITEKELVKILSKYKEYIKDISSIKEPTFSTLHNFENRSSLIIQEFEHYQKKSNKIFLKLVFKDKLMIILYIFVSLIFILTIASYILHW